MKTVVKHGEQSSGWINGTVRKERSFGTVGGKNKWNGREGERRVGHEWRRCVLYHINYEWRKVVIKPVGTGRRFSRHVQVCTHVFALRLSAITHSCGVIRIWKSHAIIHMRRVIVTVFKEEDYQGQHRKARYIWKMMFSLNYGRTPPTRKALLINLYKISKMLISKI